MSGKTIFLFGVFSILLAGEDWLQFRGPNASAVSAATGLPVEFGRDKNMLWRTPLPPGQSSPVVAGDHIFLTAVDNKRLFTFSLERATGRIQWRREAPRLRQGPLHQLNGPASPTPVSDGRNVYVFFYDFGLVSYAPDGNELWRLPLGPFNNPFGMAASPVLAGGTLVQVCDGETGSFVVALDAATGKVKWRKERPDATRGFSTPLIYRPDNGPVQALVAGSHKLMSYSVESGEQLWFVRGLTWQLKPTPVMDRDAIYVLGWAGGSDPGQQEEVQPFEEMLQRLDQNKDGKLSKEEIGDPKIVKDWAETDLDHSGYLEERDWEAYRNKRTAQNGFTAFRLGGKGDMTSKNFLWRYTKSLPNATSPLLYRNVLYLVKDGGILTSLDPRNGEVLKQARITGAAGAYYSSPVAADGRIYTLSEDGQGAVLKAGGDWELLQVNDLAEQAYASPAIVDGKIYLRTQSALYCFAGKN
jgi:outer membrane protein assembly factor BamB